MKTIANRLYKLALDARLDLEDIQATCDKNLESVIKNYYQRSEDAQAP